MSGEELKDRIIWSEMGRGTIEYAGRVESIPSSVWMSGKQAKNEVEKRLFDENGGLLSQVVGSSQSLEEIRITHASCWMEYHVFCMEMVAEDHSKKVALNLLPPAEKRPLFRDSWDLSVKAWETGVVAKPITLSADGRLFVQEWVDALPVSSIRGKKWREQRKEIITLVCQALGKLNQKGIIFYPLLDYEMMYLEEESRIVFLDTTRLKEGGYERAEDLFNFYRRSIVNGSSIGIDEFLKGVARSYSDYETFCRFVDGWDRDRDRELDLDTRSIWENRFNSC
ncbi:MAG: hypothetical protein R6U44_08080 [Archaeoglobaceae archaeon]